MIRFYVEIVEPNITRLLFEWRQGSEAALDTLLPLVYDELHRIASRQMARERSGHTLQATALVNEAWIQLAHAAKLELKDRAHFLAVAARAMRQILVQHARGHKSVKRGAGAPRLELIEALDASDAAHGDCDLLDLDQAMDKLAVEDERKCHGSTLSLNSGFGQLGSRYVAQHPLDWTLEARGTSGTELREIAVPTP